MDELLKHALEGDRSALVELLARHRRLVEGTVARLVWDRHAWRDVMQNVLVKAVRGLPGFKHTCRFSTWLYRIAVNESVEYNRKCARSRRETTLPPDDVFTDLNAPDGLRELGNRELRGDIREAIAGLPAKARACFELYYIEGHAGREAAKLQGMTEQNFFVQLKKARDRVRAYLVKRGWHT